MSENFKTIETQEELDAIIKARLERNTKSVTEEVTKKYEGYLSPEESKKLNDQIAEYTKQSEENKNTLADLNKKIAKYENDSVKMRIAREAGLPIEMASRITGDDEEAMKKDAETLAGYMKPANHVPRGKNPEGGEPLDGVEKAFYEKNPDLK